MAHKFHPKNLQSLQVATYEFQHTTSSPRFPQSNGQVERFVKTMKAMMSKSEDPYNNVWLYLATDQHLYPGAAFHQQNSAWEGKSRTTIPQSNQPLIPKWPLLTGISTEK